MRLFLFFFFFFLRRKESYGEINKRAHIFNEQRWARIDSAKLLILFLTCLTILYLFFLGFFFVCKMAFQTAACRRIQDYVSRIKIAKNKNSGNSALNAVFTINVE